MSSFRDRAARGLAAAGAVRLVQRASVRWRRGLLVLTYHRIYGAVPSGPAPASQSGVSVANFHEQVACLLQHGYPVLRMDEAVERLQRGDLNGLSVALTFDDGYESNIRLAAPVLESLRAPATLYACTGFVGSGGMIWADEILEALKSTPALPRPAEEARLAGLDAGPPVRAAVAAVLARAPGARAAALSRLESVIKQEGHAAREAMVGWCREQLDRPPHTSVTRPMTPADVARWAAEVGEVGAHTVTHPLLTQVPHERARQEIADSRRELEAWTGGQISAFCYPNGACNAAIRECVREEGYRSAVTTQRGLNGSGRSPHELLRLPAADAGSAYLRLQLAGCHEMLARFRAQIRDGRHGRRDGR